MCVTHEPQAIANVSASPNEWDAATRRAPRHRGEYRDADDALLGPSTL
jgi:hypothetical protein